MQMDLDSAFIRRIEWLNRACNDHIHDVIDSDEFQKIIHSSEDFIYSNGNYYIRSKLVSIEGELELNKYTKDEPQRTEESKNLAKHLESWIKTNILT